MAYRWDLLPGVIGALEQGRPEAALAQADELLDELAATTPGGPGLYRLRIAQVMSAWARGARAAGADASVLFDHHLRALARLAPLRTRPQMRRLARRYLAELGTFARAAAGEPEERLVAAIVADLQAQLAAPRTLAHYARASGMSRAHLSRVFRRVRGATFTRTLADLRHAQTLQLLTRTGLPVAAIARRVGLVSPSQLIAAFRRRMGTTPARWRRTRGGTGPAGPG